MDCFELPIYRFLFVMLGDRETAMDCTQDTFIRAYENLRRGRPVNAGWLYTVARNRAMDHFRRSRHRQVDLERAELLPVDGVDAAEEWVAMRDAFAQLPADDRTVLYLAAIEGLPGPEIAERLGISPHAVRMRIHRARQRFRLAYGGTP